MKITPQRPDLSQEYENPFINTYPFSKIGRCIVDKDTAEIKRWCNAEDSTLDVDGNPINFNKDTEDFMVYIPSFYYKRIWEGTVLTDSILDTKPTTLEFKGYKIHPAFIKPDGSIREYILIGAVPGHMYNGQLRSISFEENIFTSQMTLGEFRNYAKAGRDNRWGLLNIGALSVLQLLSKVAFGRVDIPYGLGRGYSAYGTPQPIQLSSTDKMGNKSGSSNARQEFISLFGIGLLWENYNEIVDGIVVRDGALYGTFNTNDTEDSSKYVKITDMGIPTGFVKDIKQLDGEFDILNIPKTIVQNIGHPNDWYSARYMEPQSPQVESIYLILGDVYNSIGRNGIFSFATIFGKEWNQSGARLCFYP